MNQRRAFIGAGVLNKYLHLIRRRKQPDDVEINPPGENAIIQVIERLLTPVTCWIGFRLDLPLETVTRTPGLVVERVEGANLFGMWKIVVLRREDGAAA